ncbi:RDD family protein [Actinomadura atramentaria]|uniref:RDD family protein n=1 Tax=Actinomadura atramentaria TaxID=1990 RepID=UPI00037F78C4|nr:RDD family protein [Actinomadura atramentaria]
MTEHPPGDGPYPPRPPQAGGASWGPPPPYREPARPSAPAQWEQPARQPVQRPVEQPTEQYWDRPVPHAGSGDEGRTQAFGTADYQPDYPDQPDYADDAGDREPGDVQLASIPRRALARLADNLLVAVFGFALILPFTIGIFGLDTTGKKTATDGAIWNWPIIVTLFAVLAVLPFAYEAIQLTMSGRTLGKRLLRLGIVSQDPAGGRLTTAQAIIRPAVNHIGYQIGLFFFLILAVKVWDYAFYGVALVAAGTLMAYLWAIWDEPFRLALHDRLTGTLVVDEREYADYGEYEG